MQRGVYGPAVAVALAFGAAGWWWVVPAFGVVVGVCVFIGLCWALGEERVRG